MEYTHTHNTLAKATALKALEDYQDKKIAENEDRVTSHRLSAPFTEHLLPLHPSPPIALLGGLTQIVTNTTLFSIFTAP